MEDVLQRLGDGEVDLRREPPGELMFLEQHVAWWEHFHGEGTDEEVAELAAAIKREKVRRRDGR